MSVWLFHILSVITILTLATVIQLKNDARKECAKRYRITEMTGLVWDTEYLNNLKILESYISKGKEENFVYCCVCLPRILTH